MFGNARLFPLSPLVAIRSVDRVFDALDPFRGGSRFAAPVFPAVNVWEDGDMLHAEAEVPGLRMENLEILVVGNELTIKGRREQTCADRDCWHRQERSAGEFTRVITLPFEINAANVEATLKDGVLTIAMPKAETARARKIEVRMA